MQAIVTGASGFVGRALRAALPTGSHALSFGSADWERALRSAPLAGATIFHLAARVRSWGGPGSKPESATRRRAAIRRVEDYLAAYPTALPSLADLCAELPAA